MAQKGPARGALLTTGKSLDPLRGKAEESSRHPNQNQPSQHDALQLAWRACTRPMYQSWLLLRGVMIALLWCNLTWNRQSGATMAAMLTAGSVGNLFFVPAFLAGWLGI